MKWFDFGGEDQVLCDLTKHVLAIQKQKQEFNYTPKAKGQVHDSSTVKRKVYPLSVLGFLNTTFEEEQHMTYYAMS